MICAGITVAMMIAVLGNLWKRGFFCFDSNGVFQKGTGYVFLYLYALVYIVLIMQRMIRSREDYTPEKDEYCRRISCDRRRMYRSGTVHRVHISVRFWTGTWSHISLSYDEQSR